MKTSLASIAEDLAFETERLASFVDERLDPGAPGSRTPTSGERGQLIEAKARLAVIADAWIKAVSALERAESMAIIPTTNA